MKETVIIIGASGHGKVIADIAIRSGDRVLGFLDDRQDLTELMGLPVLGPVSDFARYPDAAFIVAIGNGAVRRRIAEQLQGVRWYTAIHPTAVVSAMDVQIGSGTAVMAGTVINPGTRIGNHCIINTGAVVDHDNTIMDYAHISVGAKLAGGVVIGQDTWVGIGAAVSQYLTVCGGCMLGAGAVVVKSIEEPGTYVGVPARKIK